MIDAQKILRLGPPLRLTAEELDATAEIHPGDIATARVLWQRAAPPALRALLEARSEDT